MKNSGLSNPGRNAIICVILVVASTVSVLWGIAEMNALGHETGATGAAIGAGLVVGIISLAMFVLSLKGMKMAQSVRRGDNRLARWIVPADRFDAFRAYNKERNALGAGYGNDYKPSRKSRPDGVEVIFTTDGVLIDGSYFPIVTTGMYRFAGVQIIPGSPASIEFGTRMTTMSNVTVIMVHQHAGVIRVPIAPTATADAEKVLAHFQKVERREIVVQPDIWRKRIRWGLIAFLVSAVVAAIGFGLEALDVEAGMLPLLMAITGVIAAIAGLILALLGWLLHLQQHRKP
ncbi:MAG: hypothetical protein WD044_04765 [Dongiaceae bacterium]